MAHSYYSVSLWAILGGMVTLLFLMQSAVGIIEYTVGGSAGWTVGNDIPAWVAQYTFHVGDYLYFPYAAGQQSVLVVSQQDFEDCNTEHPISSDKGQGNMIIQLVNPETYYFISGVPGQCSQGLRAAVSVGASPVGSSPAVSTSPTTPDNMAPYITPYSTPLFRTANSASDLKDESATAILGAAAALAYACLAL